MSMTPVAKSSTLDDSQKVVVAYIALGANLGDREANLREALKRLGKTPDLHVERASSMFDMRHYFTSSAIWQVPVGKGRHLLSNASPIVKALLGGWQIAGVGMVRSGLPLNVTISRSATALPDQNNGSQRPNVVPGQPLYPANTPPERPRECGSCRIPEARACACPWPLTTAINSRQPPGGASRICRAIAP